MCRIIVSLLSFGCALAMFTGCGGNHISGKVTFDDGKPLDVGTVQFASDKQIFYGKIDSSGKYSLRTDDGKLENLPPGLYQVAVVGATKPGKKMDLIGGIDYNRTIPEALIDIKYTMPEISGLTCEVKGPATYNITVTKPSG